MVCKIIQYGIIKQYGEICLQQNVGNRKSNKPAFQPKIDDALHCIPKKKAPTRQIKMKFISTYAPSLSLSGRKGMILFTIPEQRGLKLI